ncbi:two-component sensor histidine kinase [Micrococcus porci]|uniref:sensor histidine kinase n=1 Tax=Micrococcus TaxID=1269 RepID=UPI001CCCC49F|nr:ATP-binding protein [Micrococcus porci]MCG7422971.1 ATP-binding protein [Micrococcus sp. ACRRV]UBH24644.1 two-component sensor histidine kinase [Micrococcus porci]
MDPVIIGLLCGAVGLLIGVASMLAFRASERSRTVDLSVEEPTLSPGAAEVLSVIGRSYIVVDAVDGVVRANPSAYAMGLVRGHTLVPDALRELTGAVRADGVVRERQVDLPRDPRHQSSLVVELRVAPLDDEYILVLAEDRTGAMRTEAMRHDFVVNVSHELKTPVGAISLLSEAIADAADDDDAVRRFARRLGVESTRLTALVQDIIEFSRLQAKDVVREGRSVDLNLVVAEAVDRVRLTAEARGISIRAGGHVDTVVHGDPDQLMTAVRNLVDNAVRYSPDGTTVGVGLTSKDGLAQITVTDQGIGISPEEQERVFERFYRVDAARSRQTGGTGLGLSIVKHVVINHGGEVTLWSQPGRGSTFTIRLPEWAQAPQTPDAGAPATVATLPERRGHRVAAAAAPARKEHSA